MLFIELCFFIMHMNKVRDLHAMSVVLHEPCSSPGIEVVSLIPIDSRMTISLVT